MSDAAISQAAMSDRLIDALHLEALVLADEAHAYFGGPGRAERDALIARDRVVFACESLKATTRSVQLVAWLTGRRAGDDALTLEEAAESDPEALAVLPSGARRLVLAGIELHQRARRLANGAELSSVTALGPARSILNRLERAF